jgi:RimJ/RimL family protein N-acetyltransferase
MPPVAIRRYAMPDRWCERIVLHDGRDLVIRPIEPADGEVMQRAFALLEPDEIRMRFLHPLKELTPELAHRLTHPDPRREFALIVAEPLPAGEALMCAVARASIDAEQPKRAEFAILVSRYVARQGLGRLLMQRLIRWARLKRLDELYGDVLDENTAMLHLAETLGFRREHLLADPGMVRVRLSLKTKQTTV